jgi:hypothetical protein
MMRSTATHVEQTPSDGIDTGYRHNARGVVEPFKPADHTDVCGRNWLCAGCGGLGLEERSAIGV